MTVRIEYNTAESQALAAMHGDNEIVIQQTPNIIEANCGTITIEVREFLEAVTPCLKRVFKTFIRKYCWDKGDKVCISDVFTLYRDGTSLHEAQVFFLASFSPYYQKAGKLREEERVLLKERIKRMKNDWRVCYG